MMKNAPCTPLTPEEEAAIMRAFPSFLTPAEEEDTASLFQPYVFYEPKPDRSRDCWCTSCGQYFNVPRRGHADFFRASHKGKRSATLHESKADCPMCGKESVLVAANRFSNFNSLCEYRLVVHLTAWDGWLLAQSGVVVRNFYWNDYHDIDEKRDFYEFRRFAFKPGRRKEWHLLLGRPMLSQYYWKRAGVSDFLPGGCYAGAAAVRWIPAQSVGEAHYPVTYQEQPYYIINPDALKESDMRYCQYFAWFDAEYGAYVEESRYHVHLCRYLSEFTRRPQMEFLVKLGYEKIISDLLLRQSTNRDLVNWKAKNPADFFKLVKADFRVFHDAHCDRVDLKRFHEMKSAGLVRDMREFANCKKSFNDRLGTFCACCIKTRVTMRRGAAYVTGTAMQLLRQCYDVNYLDANYLNVTQFPLYMRDAVTLWDDYIDAALKLDYDLARDDVRMPKNLTERHDVAIDTVRMEADKEKQKAYLRAYPRLKQRYEYSEDGLEIVVPTCAQEIILEGRILHHCVGGYANRHMEGKLSILFLRKEDAPSMPYVTIEMTVDNNPKNLCMVQIHGYRNDRDAPSPRVTHKDFLDHWLAWVHDGSPRADDGTPLAAKEIV